MGPVTLPQFVSRRMATSKQITNAARLPNQAGARHMGCAWHDMGDRGLIVFVASTTGFEIVV